MSSSEHPPQRASVGVFGLGGVGAAVARRLLAAGITPWGFRRGSMEAFVGLGGRASPSAQALIRTCDVVLNCAPPAASEELCGMYVSPEVRPPPGQILVDLGVSPLTLRIRLRDALRSVGATMLDAPIMGNPPLIEAGRAVAYVSGERAAAETVGQLMNAFTMSAPYVGPFGHGTRLKLVSNLLLAVHTVAAAEAIALARRTGLDPRLLSEHLPPIARSGVFDARSASMVERRFGHGAGSAAMLLDVVRTIQTEAAACQGRVPTLDAAATLLQQVVDAGMGDRDSPVVAALLDGMAWSEGSS